MNKLAAEKIAQEYYNIGVQLAMQNSGLVKEAGLPNKEIIKKLVQAPAAGFLAVNGAYGSYDILKHLIKKHELLDLIGRDPIRYAALAAGGGLALAGSHLAGKGVDLAHRGGSKAIDALKKLRN